eukprot:TRINITY_DN4723_c1_g1_i6.p1 TRINITY_DN4723_c1_g1~~TRINITY_DN4723_c1_g1_i6.p1  ORF type:complete len:128 (-),score=13.90 TRINITY_DN4723_c1_g1_i6:39-422(-)
MDIQMHSDNIAISLDLINRHYQEPNRNRYESRYFWEELYTLIAASGFSAIEIPYEPVWQFGGRSGVPFNRYCVTTKYGDATHYRALLTASGIGQVRCGGGGRGHAAARTAKYPIICGNVSGQHQSRP